MRLSGVLFLIVHLACLTSGVAQESVSAAAVTANGRSLAQALDAVLRGQGQAVPAGRALVFLIDPTSSLSKAGFAAELNSALSRNAERLSGTRIGVAEVGGRGTWLMKPNDDHAAVMVEVAKLMAKPNDEMRNVYHDVRAVASGFDGDAQLRELVLVSLDNGDAEDDLEATVGLLSGKGVRFHCIASEAYLSDSYWASRPSQDVPSKCTLTGGDGAFVELPWGWLFQTAVANEVAPSGTAMYPFSRLAAATSGRAYLYAPPSSGHQCAIYGSCLFCNNDHSPTTESYWAPRVALYASPTASRRENYVMAASDPAFRAMLEAWSEASRAGLIRSSPSVKVSGKGLVPLKPRGSRSLNLHVLADFDRQAARAMNIARECDAIRVRLDKRLAAMDESTTSPRYRAMAAFTSLMLRLTKVNLIGYHGWCRELAPRVVSPTPPDLALPEIDGVDRSRRASGIGVSNYCLCHGVSPFFSVELPGGEAFREGLVELDSAVKEFETRYGHTPFAAALHRSGIAHFWLTYPGIARANTRARPKSQQDQEGATTRGRPARAGPSSGAGAGSTTGK